MSKIGKKNISIPESVNVAINEGIVKVKGPKGELSLALHPKVRVILEGKNAQVSVANSEDRRQRALWGTFRSLIQNMIEGVNVGYEKKLEIVGVGYKAAVEGNNLNLSLGYSHPIKIRIPKSLSVKVEKNTIIIMGANKQEVGGFASFVRSRRPPEPYKGKGVRYTNEIVRRKAGKVVKAVGAG